MRLTAQSRARLRPTGLPALTFSQAPASVADERPLPCNLFARATFNSPVSLATYAGFSRNEDEQNQGEDGSAARKRGATVRGSPWPPSCSLCWRSLMPAAPRASYAGRRRRLRGQPGCRTGRRRWRCRRRRCRRRHGGGQGRVRYSRSRIPPRLPLPWLLRSLPPVPLLSVASCHSGARRTSGVQLHPGNLGIPRCAIAHLRPVLRTIPE